MMVLFKICIMIFQAALPGVGIYLNKISVDLLTQVAFGDKGLVGRALITILLSSSLSLVMMGIGLLTGLVDQHLGLRVSQEIDQVIIQKAINLELVLFDSPDLYDKMQRAKNGFDQRATGTVNALFQAVSQLMTVASFIIAVSLAGWSLSFMLLPVVMVALYLNMRWGRQRYQLARSQTHTQREVGYLYGTLSGGEAAKEIRLFNLGSYLLKRWRNLSLSIKEEQLALFWRQGRANMFNNLLSFAASMSAVLFLFFRLSDRQITLGTYTAVLSAFSGALGLMPQIAGVISQVYENGLYTNDFLDYLALPERTSTGTRSFPKPLRRTICTNDLFFRYPGNETPALRGISLSIAPGERVAIVGENGSGKTTLAKCLLGFYAPLSGNVQYDGVDLRDIQSKSFYENVTAVFQDFTRFMVTVRENIGFGNIDRMQDLEALEQAAAKAGIMDVIRSHPQSWDTRLGRVFEGGKELSYGQWQRVAIARALFRNAQIVILDEPTAALDPKGEAALFEQFLEMTQGRTSIIISHRLGMTRFVDRILVLKDGKLVEDGTHEQLLDRDGEYARMFKTQARWYTDAADDPLVTSVGG